jgi:hypothetical protein
MRLAASGGSRMETMLAYLVIEQDRRGLYLAEDLSDEQKRHAEKIAKEAEESGLIFG